MGTKLVDECKCKSACKNDPFWLTQDQIATLFGVQKAAISKHIKNIYQSGKLVEKATVSNMETVRQEGKRKVRRQLEYYNLDLVLSVGWLSREFEKSHPFSSVGY
jgi:hypothetical protein